MEGSDGYPSFHLVTDIDKPLVSRKPPNIAATNLLQIAVVTH